MWPRRIALLVLPLFVFTLSVAAQESQSTSLPQTKTISDWIGERFVFLQRKPALRSYGYQLINKKGKRFGSLPYEKYSGRIARVVKVTPASAVVRGSWKVDLVMEDDGEELTADAVNYKVDGIAPYRDIAAAKSMYKGKSLWLKERLIPKHASRSAREDYVNLESVPAEVKIIDVVLGDDNASPARFLLQTPSGEVGYVDVSLSGTNADESLRKYHLFDKYFMNPSASTAAPKAPAALPPGRFKITTSYDRFTDTTVATLQETLARIGEGVGGLWITAYATYQGTKPAANPEFKLSLSYTATGSHTAPLQFSDSDNLLLLTGADRLSLPITDYKYRRSEVMGWVSEDAKVNLDYANVLKLLNAKAVDGRWGSTEFRFNEKSIEAFREFVERLQP